MFKWVADQTDTLIYFLLVAAVFAKYRFSEEVQICLHILEEIIRSISFLSAIISIQPAILFYTVLLAWFGELAFDNATCFLSILANLLKIMGGSFAAAL